MRATGRGRATGAGVRVCVVDSGVDATHPRVGPIQRAVTVPGRARELASRPIPEVTFGHGTACAAWSAASPPTAQSTPSASSVPTDRDGPGAPARPALGDRAALRGGQPEPVHDQEQVRAELHELADRAYFRGTLLVASATNMAVESFPWCFSSVPSVGSHAGSDPREYYVNPYPPVEFAAPGVDLELAWLTASTIRASGTRSPRPTWRGSPPWCCPSTAPCDRSSSRRRCERLGTTSGAPRERRRRVRPRAGVASEAGRQAPALGDRRGHPCGVRGQGLLADVARHGHPRAGVRGRRR